jgi:hypothetical protein
MTDLLAALIQMAMSVGFHIIFAALGSMAAGEWAISISMATFTLLHFVPASVVRCATWRHIAAVMPSALKDA